MTVVMAVIASTIVICVLVWYFGRDKYKRHCAISSYNRSAGTFDKSAQDALSALNDITRPTPADSYLAGSIIQHNLLGAAPTTTPAARAGPLRNTMRFYTDALQGLDEAPQADIGRDFMRHRIGELGDQLRDEDIDQAILGEVMRFTALTDVVLPKDAIGSAKARTQKARRDQSAGASRSSVMAQATADATEYTDDKQNVHDRAVNTDLRNVKARLEQTYDGKSCTADIGRYIAGNDHKATNARRALAEVAKGGPIGTFETTEDHILDIVWSRCAASQNRERAADMRAAVIDALADSVEGGTVVCANGRMSRLLNSLTLLDYDPVVAGGAMTFEAYRNTIFGEVNDRVNEVVAAGRASSNDKMRIAATAFDSGDSSSAAAPAISAVRDTVDAIVDGYADKIGERESRILKQECYVYAGIAE